MESMRVQKISRLIQKEMADIFQREVRNLFHGKMVTVTVVRTSPDLGIAKVYLSVFPSKDSEETLSVVREHKGHIRNILGHRIKNQMRKIPDIAFYIDDSLDYIDNIDRLLKS